MARRRHPVPVRRPRMLRRPPNDTEPQTAAQIRRVRRRLHVDRSFGRAQQPDRAMRWTSPFDLAPRASCPLPGHARGSAPARRSSHGRLTVLVPLTCHNAGRSAHPSTGSRGAVGRPVRDRGSRPRSTTAGRPCGRLRDRLRLEADGDPRRAGPGRAAKPRPDGAVSAVVPVPIPGRPHAQARRAADPLRRRGPLSRRGAQRRRRRGPRAGMSTSPTSIGTSRPSPG
jgi:hypothetical protein